MPEKTPKMAAPIMKNLISPCLSAKRPIGMRKTLSSKR
jgi:hypothetical protein